MRARELYEAIGRHNIPMSKKYTSEWDAPAGFIDLSSIVPYIEAKGIKPTKKEVLIQNLRATQDWVDHPYGGGDPVFDEYKDKPVVIHDGAEYHIIDGHHRVDKAIIKGKDHIKAWVFEL